MSNKAFYLKANRKEEFALKNLARWIDVAYLMNADCYIVCDDDVLKALILDTILFYKDVTFMESCKNSTLHYIVDAIANRNWVNASYAHLTTFWHSYGKYDYFWNIDADDTRFCVPINKIVEILKETEAYAEKKHIDCFSLDMWNSETYGKHWSFGVTYVNGETDWIDLCLRRCNDIGYVLMDKEGNQNIDWFFTYLRTNTDKNICTFYVENLKFIHYSNDFFEKPIGSGLYHWKLGKLIYPMVYYGIGIEEIGVYKIPSDNVKINVNISDKETSGTLAYYTREGKDLGKYYEIEEMINNDICQKKFEAFKRKHGFSEKVKPEIVCFGAGNALEKNYKKIKKIFNVKFVCDNDTNKWGKKIVGDIVCISPDQLNSMVNIIVIILVYSTNIINQISEQLSKMGIEYDYMDNWFRCAE